MHKALVVINFLASVASAFAAVTALMRPASLSGSKHVSGGERFYVRMYAARSVPLGMAAGMLPFWLAGPAVAWLVFTAAFVQALDIVIGIQQKERKMVVGATTGAMAHLLCGFAVM